MRVRMLRRRRGRMRVRVRVRGRRCPRHRTSGYVVGRRRRRGSNGRRRRSPLPRRCNVTALVIFYRAIEWLVMMPNMKWQMGTFVGMTWLYLAAA